MCKNMSIISNAHPTIIYRPSGMSSQASPILFKIHHSLSWLLLSFFLGMRHSKDPYLTPCAMRYLIRPAPNRNFVRPQIHVYTSAHSHSRLLHGLIFLFSYIIYHHALPYHSFLLFEFCLPYRPTVRRLPPLLLRPPANPLPLPREPSRHRRLCRG